MKMKTIKVYTINTKTEDRHEYQTLADAKDKCIPLSAKTGYTFKVYNTNTGELIGNIRPNPHVYKTKSNTKGKVTARFIRQD